MCGIAGLIDRRLAGDAAELARRAEAMALAVAHRGPDGSGVWLDAAAGAALAHRRLAIIDLSEAGAQPMLSQDGRWAISYNGEVYNAEDLRRGAELSGIAWKGHSDTEVMIELVARRGVASAIKQFNGMFAIALWDRATQTLHLVRDRLGIKPLFFAIGPNSVHFASELKSLHAVGAIAGDIDPASVASFLRFGYVPAPHSIYRGVEKVLPGEHIAIALDGRVTRERYWSAQEVARRGIADPLDISDEDAVDELTRLLGDAVVRQMLSDVPLGVFLSGGIDSSTVTALMVAAARGKVRSFSIGFTDLDFDESRYAAAVARHLGTDHAELMVAAGDALAVVPQLPEMYDEPFADSSQIPTHLVSKLTRDHVTVALSGDGGDELFAGYNRYQLAEGLWQKLGGLPMASRRALSSLLNLVPIKAVDRLAALAPKGMLPPQPADKLRKLADVLTLDRDQIYLRLVSQCDDPARLAPTAAEHPLPDFGAGMAPTAASFLDRMQLADTLTYLPDDILQKVDRASMAVALEARPPILDHRVVEFAWRLPRRFKIRDGETKWLLRRVAERYVPRQLLDRPKMGFGIPLADWLRGPLRDWAEDLLDPKRLGGGLIDPQPARALWTEHLSGGRNRAYALWTVLMFEAWRRRWDGARN
jgi:asparagine synthase (glutamine-hydrolysing)